jgi:hypothetical protein
MVVWIRLDWIGLDWFGLVWFGLLSMMWLMKNGEMC